MRFYHFSTRYLILLLLLVNWISRTRTCDNYIYLNKSWATARRSSLPIIKFYEEVKRKLTQGWRTALVDSSYRFRQNTSFKRQLVQNQVSNSSKLPITQPFDNNQPQTAFKRPNSERSSDYRRQRVNHLTHEKNEAVRKSIRSSRLWSRK